MAMDAAGSIVGNARPRPPEARRSYPVEFTGRAGEYFRIWLPNLLLTVVTLGIYGPWAKVRNTQYIYGHVSIDGASFDYTARPLDILKGRIIAVGVLAIYSVVARFAPLFEPVLVLALLLAIPWMVVLALRFRMRNTRYRNVRFTFGGGFGRAFLEYFVMWLLVIVTVGLAYPYVRWRQTRYVLNHTGYGGSTFRFGVPLLDYYLVYLLPLLVVILAFVVLAVGVSLVLPSLGLEFEPQERMPAEARQLIVIALLAFNVIIYLAAAYVALYVGAQTRNLVFNHGALDQHRFRSRVRVGKLLGLWIVNIVALIFTLGLAWAWVRVRMARYYASCTTLRAAGDLNAFVNRQEAESRALGEEMGEVFDFDIGL